LGARVLEWAGAKRMGMACSSLLGEVCPRCSKAKLRCGGKVKRVLLSFSGASDQGRTIHWPLCAYSGFTLPLAGRRLPTKDASMALVPLSAERAIAAALTGRAPVRLVFAS